MHCHKTSSRVTPLHFVADIRDCEYLCDEINNNNCKTCIAPIAITMSCSEVQQTHLVG